MLKILDTSREIPEYIDGTIVNNLEFTDQIIRPNYGKPLAKVFPSLTIEISTRNPRADYFQSGGHHFVSARLKKQLEAMGVNGEFFGVTLASNGELISDNGYFYLNLLDVVECLDEVNGRYSYSQRPGSSNRVDKLFRLVLREESTVGHHLFYVARLTRAYTIASQELQDAIKAGRFSGVAFRPLEWCTV